MSLPTEHLASTRAEIEELAKAATRKSGSSIILVPIDFSSHSESALIKAAEFADMLNAALIVLHVVHDPGEMPGYYSKLIKKKRATRIQDIAAEAFSQFMQRIAEENLGRTSLRDTQTLMVIGLPVTRILEVVELVNPTFVVMGSQGRTGLKHLVIGSKANQVMQLCPVPVMIVKKRQVKT